MSLWIKDPGVNSTDVYGIQVYTFIEAWDFQALTKRRLQSQLWRVVQLDQRWSVSLQVVVLHALHAWGVLSMWSGAAMSGQGLRQRIPRPSSLDLGCRNWGLASPNYYAGSIEEDPWFFAVDLSADYFCSLDDTWVEMITVNFCCWDTYHIGVNFSEAIENGLLKCWGLAWLPASEKYSTSCWCWNKQFTGYTTVNV
jgi:hypothetical protein